MTRQTIFAGYLMLALFSSPAFSRGAAQTTGGQAAPATEKPLKPDISHEQPASPVTSPRTEKQQVLEGQAERLVDMATQLQEQVDKTNKNILSLTVVAKAEQIEQFAHKMKVQAKK